jgi:N6-adenosine-specific RNA methylase IME4
MPKTEVVLSGNGLIPLEQACRALEVARRDRDVPAAREIREEAAAVTAYLKRRRDLGLKAAQDAAEVKVRAERVLGELLAETVGPGRPGKLSQPATVLPEGVSRSDSSRWQQVAQVPAEDFEQHLAETRDLGEVATTAAAVRLAARLADDERARGFATETPPLPAGPFRTVIADPPWPLTKSERTERPAQGRRLRYRTMTVEQVESLGPQILARAADDCHLYLWVTQRFLPDGLRVLAAWGFQYHCQLTWVKPSGFTPFSFMFNAEHVLFGYRGKLKLQRVGLKVAFEAPAPRGQHSVKPDAFYDLVRQASPGPRACLFMDRQLDGFTCWGDECPNGDTP